MKMLFFLAALAVVGLVVTGAIKMQKSTDTNTISIQIDKERVHEDADRVVDEGRHVLEEAESALGSSTTSPQR